MWHHEEKPNDQIQKHDTKAFVEGERCMYIAIKITLTVTYTGH